MILADAGFSIGDPTQWRLRKAMAGGGSLMDIGIYSLNAARYLSGEEPVEVNAMTHTTPNDPRFTEVEENINFQLKFPERHPRQLHVQLRREPGPVPRVQAARLVRARPGRRATRACGCACSAAAASKSASLPQRDHFALEMDHFSASIMNNTEPLTPGEEGLKDLRVMMAIYEAARSGKTVKL